MIIRISSRPRIQTPHASILKNFLAQNPHCHLAYIDTNNLIPTITAHTSEPYQLPIKHIHDRNDEYQINWLIDEPPRTLELPLPAAQTQSKFTECQNAPIKLGCQIQPHRKNWVGTAGGPIKFKTPDGQNHWGIITNAHVSGTPTTPAERQIHQPNDTRPPIATTTIYAYPSPNQENYLDVALCDSRQGNAHKTSWEILEQPKLATTWTNATRGMPATKTGRTTGRTTGQVTATNAAARVNYGSFIALMLDLDVIQSTTPFSAPGDSGSLILNADTGQPIALLFAGSTTTTLAIPIRNIAKAVQISFKP